MFELNIILLIILMFSVAVIYSNIGLGGGMLYVPLLLLLTPFSKNEIIGISLFLAFLTGLGSAYNHWKKKLVEFRTAVILSAATIPSAVFGGTLGVKTGEKFVYSVFGIILVLVCIRMIFEVCTKPDDSRDRNKGCKNKSVPRSSIIVGTLAAIVTGILSGMFGVGGGLVLIAVMLYLFRMKTRLAMGTSAIIILPTALTAFGTYFYHSYFAGEFELNLLLAFLLGLCVLVGSLLGSYWGLRALRTKQIKLIFITVILLASIEVWYKVWS